MTFVEEVNWMLGVGLLAILNLFSLAKVVSSLIQLSAGTAKNVSKEIFQASYWAVIKLGCLALLVILALR